MASELEIVLQRSPTDAMPLHIGSVEITPRDTVETLRNRIHSQCAGVPSDFRFVLRSPVGGPAFSITLKQEKLLTAASLLPRAIIREEESKSAPSSRPSSPVKAQDYYGLSPALTRGLPLPLMTRELPAAPSPQSTLSLRQVPARSRSLDTPVSYRSLKPIPRRYTASELFAISEMKKALGPENPSDTLIDAYRANGFCVDKAVAAIRSGTNPPVLSCVLTY
mmetsp:Transcript_5362/g.8315  ORF Transcript_5362/g.8315 Transcript_5362/m.8315 type:complete len:222 (-) Transcript_5362:286-951(-)